MPARARVPIAAILFVAGMSASLAQGGSPAFAGSVPVGDASVTAHPREPGSAALLTVSFSIRETLEIDDTITLEVDDTLGVPRTIRPDAVSITGLATTSRTGPDGSGAQARVVSQPSAVRVEANRPRERHVIILSIPDMSGRDSAGNVDDLVPGRVTITFYQDAGITNRTGVGQDRWFVYTSAESDPAEIPVDRVYQVPALVELGEYHSFRGDKIRVEGRGFERGTTVQFWRDSNNDHDLDPGEAVLCTAIATQKDRARCTFTLTVPPFKGGSGIPGNRNFINGRDGHGHASEEDVPLLHLEPHLTITPTSGGRGEVFHVRVSDVDIGDRVYRIELAGLHVLCEDGHDADQDGNPDLPCSAFLGGEDHDDDEDGGLHFDIVIPPRSLHGDVIPFGVLQLRLMITSPDGHTHDKELETLIHVTPGQLETSPSTVRPNQRITVRGSGFATSSNKAGDFPAFIGRPPPGTRHGCTGGFWGRVALNGQEIPWERVNGDRAIEVSSGGAWHAPIDLPVNPVTTHPGSPRLEVQDCLGGAAYADLIVPERELEVTPPVSPRGSKIVVTGRNFPVSHGQPRRDLPVNVEYHSGGRRHHQHVQADPLGNFTAVLRVPKGDDVPHNNTIRVWFMDDHEAVIAETVPHLIPYAAISLEPDSGPEGSTIMVTAEGFPRYTQVDTVTLGGRDITPVPRPLTGGSGGVSFSVLITGFDPGIHVMRVEVAGMVATNIFTVSPTGLPFEASTTTVLGNLIAADALDRVFRFDNATKEWEWHIQDPGFALTNTLASLSSGDLVWVRVTRDVTADILGAPVELSCANEGTDKEDCWNQIAIP